MENNLKKYYLYAIIILLLNFLTTRVSALGIRSFVAVPVAQGDFILRAMDMQIADESKNTVNLSAAYGITSEQTLMVMMPYRIAPRGPDRTGNATFLYRGTVYHQDSEYGTQRLGVLLGAGIPTVSDKDGNAVGGLVGTYFKGRNQIDADALWGEGFNQQLDTGQYDLSWQYRIFPREYSEWGLGSALNTVLEYNGRWTEHSDVIHSITAGLQWVNPQWILEGGISQDMSKPHDLLLLLGLRFHF